MDNVNIDDFISKVNYANSYDFCHGFKINDCVQISTICYHGKRAFTLNISGCITDISLNNSLLNITVTDCISNIKFVFHDFDDFKKLECDQCLYL